MSGAVWSNIVSPVHLAADPRRGVQPSDSELLIATQLCSLRPGSFIDIADASRRREVEKLLIKFLKSNVVVGLIRFRRGFD